MSRKAPIRPEHHGTTTGYTYGCRDACCRAAVAQHQRARYRLQADEIHGGTLTPADITLPLLTALTCLTELEREAWIDWNLHGTARSRQLVHTANQRLRRVLVSAEHVMETA